jgi:predicted RNA-binding Zn ribbon-like protein
MNRHHSITILRIERRPVQMPDSDGAAVEAAQRAGAADFDVAATMRAATILAPALVTPAMFEHALQLRTGVRAYLQCDPGERRKDRNVLHSLNKALSLFPLEAELGNDRGMMLRAARGDALAGMSTVVAELYDGSVRGTLDRLKMCAAQECRRVFFDRSKPATRRWCMSTLCGNRTKTRTYRERHRAAG